LCAVFGSSRGPRVDTEDVLMHFTFAIETSKPCGKSFRLALGITIPLGLVWMALSLVRLF
jgi:hypothetical protein